MTKDSSASLEEAKLRNELLRIRNTFSFRLGLLLTDSLFRKPWLIFIFPYLFMKMILDFVRNRKHYSTFSNETSLSAYNSECILLFVASEGGKAACERAKELAAEWLSEYRNHLVIVSSNTGLIGFNQPNLSLYMIPDPKSKENIDRSQWNKSCENTMFRAIYTHLPRLFLFDGPYPYRGVLNAIESAQDMESVWIQSERTNEEIKSKASSYFSKIRKMDYLEKSLSNTNNTKRNYHSLTNKLLLATGYGSHEGSQKTPNNVLNSLSNYENIHLIGVKNTTMQDQSSQYAELWDEVIENPAIPKLQGAIVSDNIELITKLHSNMVPTLCILHKNTTKDVRSVIQTLAMSGTLFVSQWNEKDEINLYIQALLNREWNLSISQRGTVSDKSTIFNEFIRSE